MFTYQELPKIPGYGYIANAPLTPVNWKNASGVTDMKVFVVKNPLIFIRKPMVIKIIIKMMRINSIIIKLDVTKMACC